jgi:hypothetical protein
MGGPKGRRRVEQGFLGAEHFLQPDGKLKKQTRKRVGLTGMKVRSAAFFQCHTCITYGLCVWFLFTAALSV